MKIEIDLTEEQWRHFVDFIDVIDTPDVYKIIEIVKSKAAPDWVDSALNDIYDQIIYTIEGGNNADSKTN